MNEPTTAAPASPVFPFQPQRTFDIVEEGNMLLVFSAGVVDDAFCAKLLERCETPGSGITELLLDLRDAVVLDTSVDLLKVVERYARGRGLFLGITNAPTRLRRDLDYPGSCVEWLD